MLLDEAGRKRGMDGVAYAVTPSEVIERYDTPMIPNSN